VSERAPHGIVGRRVDLRPDFGLTADDYARHRAGFPESLFERLAARRIGLAGQTVVDVGTGTGALARGFARRGCRVVGIDPSSPMLEQARRLDAGEELSVEYRVGRAEQTGLADGIADVVSAGQCWHWFDRPRAAAEAARLLRAGGAIVIAHFDWIPLAGNVVRATEELIERHNPAWKLGWGLGVHPQWLRDLGEAGYREIESFAYDVDAPYTPEAWRGRIRASAGVGGTLPPDQVKEFDQALELLLATRYPGDLLQIPHRVFAVLARPPLGQAARDAGSQAEPDADRASRRASSGAVTVAIREADLGDPAQGAALVEIVDSYARGPGGQGAPLTEAARANLVKGLVEHPAAFVLLAFAGGRAVGAAVCVWGFSTFAGRPFVNVHDLAVLPDFQGRGVGSALLEQVERRARERGCCKLTLEVHDTNRGAKRLYERFGFGPWVEPQLYVTKRL
jgi:ribosomal protein S18 acetylase RimI-like enzyme